MAVDIITSMKTLYNFLNNDIINQAHSEVGLLIGRPVWNTSYNIWEPGLVANGVGGCVAITHLSDQLTETIATTLLPHVPPCTEISLTHCLFYPGSGINYHNDGGYTFGATIYLSLEWNINHGGMFIYGGKDGDNTDDLKVLFPTFNSLVINTDKEYHMVTAISPLAPKPRYTIQIWGK